MRRFVAIALTALLGACAVGPNYQSPAAPPEAKLALRETDVAGVTPTPLPAEWWRLFNDPVLDRLIDAALRNNTDLRQAAANLQRARASLSESRASLLPTGDASAQYTRQRNGGNANSQFFQVSEYDFYRVGYDASYEVDLFGGVRRGVEAARADLAAAQAQVDASRVAIAAETARAYVSACSYAARAAVARQTMEYQDKTVDLTQRLYRGGRGTPREVAQATVLLEQAKAQVPQLEAERRAALYALAALTGESPTQPDADAERCVAPPSPAEAIPVGDGRSLLARRPDVRQAERALAASVARVGVATADLYPSITLLGSVTLGANRIGDLGKAPSVGFSLGPLISWNFPFNGAARARVRESKADATAALAAFDGKVLAALRETEQALARLGGAVEREEALGRAAAASDRAAQISGIRYRAGADSFLQLLDAERDRSNARAAYAQAQAERADAQISLFKALGGGWENAPPVVETPATR